MQKQNPLQTYSIISTIIYTDHSLDTNKVYRTITQIPILSSSLPTIIN